MTYDDKRNKWGLSQFYNNIELFPLKLSDENEIEIVEKLLKHNKNKLHYSCIKMSYLKFMLCILGSQENYSIFGDVQSQIETLIKHITKKDVALDIKVNGDFDEFLSNVMISLYVGEFDIVKNPESGEELKFPKNCVRLSETEFDKLREIILLQNGYNLSHINEYDPNLEKALDSISKPDTYATSEERFFSYCAYMKIDPNEVYGKTTLYQYNKTMERISFLLSFELFKPLETSGQISFKDKNDTIKDWLCKTPNVGRYDSILISKEKFKKDSDFSKITK